MSETEWLRRVLGEVFTQGTWDWLADDMIIGEVEEESHEKDKNLVFEKVMHVIHILLEEGLAEPGEFEGEFAPFEPWDLPTEEALRRILSNMEKKIKKNVLDTFLWFRLTKKGMDLAKKIEASEHWEPLLYPYLSKP